MKQLKGKAKETAKEKKQRKKEFADSQKQMYTIVLPTLAAVAALIIAYIYIRTRPTQMI